VGQFISNAVQVFQNIIDRLWKLAITKHSANKTEACIEIESIRQRIGLLQKPTTNIDKFMLDD